MNEALRMKHENINGPVAADRPDPERYFRLGESMLRQLRADLVEAELAHLRHRADLVNRVKDDLARLDVEHKQRAGALGMAIARLEAMQDG
jgi:hypothetical protein